MTHEGDILKYKKYCIINDCKKLSSFNYPGKKELLYCDDHELDKMINIRKGYLLCEEHNVSYVKYCKQCKQVNCLLCNETVNKQHYFSKKHIDNFDKNITITTRNCIKKKFIDIIFNFHIIDKDVFYKDLYFKDKVKTLILKNRKKDKNYKISIYKYNQSVRGDLTNFWIEKFNLDNISEIDNIDKLNLKNFKFLKPIDFEDQISLDRDTYDGTDNLENLNIISEGTIEYDDGSIKTIQNTRLVIKMSECQLFSAGNSSKINKIPDLFFKKRNLVIMKNLNDNKCLLYCYIRKHLNPITTKLPRIIKKDIQISKDLVDKFNIDFENVSISEIDKIEDLLECNIHVFGCNREFNGKKIIRKSLKDYDKYLDLLLINEINHYILIKNINIFIGNNFHIVKSCRNCLNSFYSTDKYNFHIDYCKNRKPKKLLPSFKKYMYFENLKNCIKQNWIIHSDFECVIDPITKEYNFISGGYLVECKNEKYSKDIQTFYNLEEYTKSLYNELKYIEQIEENRLQNPIDYSKFDEKEFDNTLKCKHCDCDFNHPYNDRCIILNEIVDKDKLKYILDNNDYNQEINYLAKNYYDSLDDLGRKRITYKQKYNYKNRYYGIGSCLSYLKKEIRNSIMPSNIKDVEMINSYPVILLYLCQKNGVACNILKNYVDNRDLILNSFSNNRKQLKEMFLTILNGGFKDKCSEDSRINNYLKLLENEVVKIQEYFYSKGKRYFENGFNYLGNNLSRIILDIENQILQIMINYFVLKRVNILTLEYDGLKIYSDNKSRHFSINELEKFILEKTGINMKLLFKDITDSYPEFGIRCNTDNIKNENIIENKLKVVHHDYVFKDNNMLSIICRECNLQIKNNKTVPIFFFNGMKYDNTILYKSL